MTAEGAVASKSFAIVVQQQQRRSLKRRVGRSSDQSLQRSSQGWSLRLRYKTVPGHWGSEEPGVWPGLADALPIAEAELREVA